jgi:single-strand DNA-binding protein
MSSINNCIFTGNLGRDPELKQTTGGTAVLELNLCVSDRAKGKDGEWFDKPNWIKCIVYGKRAEFFSSLKKGDLITTMAKVSTRSYKDKDGKTIYVTEFISDHIVTARGKPNSTQGGAGINLSIDESEELPF